jgi:hypothetical protein
MGKASIFCILVVFALLLEDGSSVRKRTEEEEREDREIAEKVNSTLAEEKKKEDEEKRRENEKKKKLDQEENKKRGQNKKEVMEDKNEACLPTNTSCPIVEPCPEERECPAPVDCPECPSVRCDPCLPCDPCPTCFNQTCRPCHPCKPCQPCPVSNSTVEDFPTVCQCPEGTGLSLPAAVAVGAVTGLLVTGVAAGIGLLLRYVSPIESGFLFLASIVILWYLCSQYPETARELGARAATLLREAATSLSHRVVEALRHHNEQVGFPVLILFFLLPDLSSMFEKKGLH